MERMAFALAVKEIYKKHIPNGFACSRNLCLGDGISFNFGLIENINDVANNIRVNDPVSIGMIIHDWNDQKIEIEFTDSYFYIPPVSRYFAMSLEKVSSRKINNTPAKALKSLDKYFTKFANELRQAIAAEGIYNQTAIPEKYLNF